MAYDGSLKFDTKIDPAGFTGGVAQLKSTALAAVGAIGAAFASGAIAKALVSQIGLVEQYGSAINDQAQRISISTKAYQELSYIFEQTGGSADVLQTGIKTLSNAVVDGSEAFEDIGLKIDDVRKMSQEDLFDLVLTQLAEMPPSAKRTAAAVDLLGRSATELNPLFSLGAAGIARMKQQAHEYGLVMTDEAVAATDAYGDAVTLAQKSGEALRNAIVGKMMPALTGLAGGFADIAKEATEAFNARGVSGVVDVITDKFPGATAAVSGLAAAFAALLIVDILTPSVKMLAAAQKILNAAMAASPVLVLAASIGVLVGAVTLLDKQYEKLNPDASKAIDVVDELRNEVELSNGTFDESAKTIESQRRGAESLIDTLSEMSDTYSGTGIEQRKMQAIVDQLNGSIDGLSLSFDSQTGKLSMNANAIRDVVKAQYDAAQSTAELSRYTRLLAEQSDAEYAVQVARKAFYAAGAGSGATLIERQKLNKALRDAIGIYDGVTAALADSNAKINEQSGAYDSVDESLNVLGYRLNDTADAQERVIIGGYDFTDSLAAIGMTADQVSDRLNNFSGAATNMFDKIDTKSRVTVKAMIDNLTANTAAMQQWGDNIALLGDKLPAELLQPLIDQGPEKMAGVLNNLAKATPEQLAELTAAFTSGGDAAKQAWLDSLGAGTEIADSNPAKLTADAITADTTLQPAVEQAATDAKTAMVVAVANNKFSDIGKFMLQGVIVGMLGQKKNVIAAAVILATAANNAFRNTLSIKSPSRKGIENGAYYGEGVALGLLDKVARVRDAGATLANAVISPAAIPSLQLQGASYGAAATTSAAFGGINGGVHITVAGKVENDVQLARRVTKEFEEVVAYGRRR